MAVGSWPSAPVRGLAPHGPNAARLTGSTVGDRDPQLRKGSPQPRAGPVLCRGAFHLRVLRPSPDLAAVALFRRGRAHPPRIRIGVTGNGLGVLGTTFRRRPALRSRRPALGVGDRSLPETAQDLDALFGKILRLDVRRTASAPSSATSFTAARPCRGVRGSGLHAKGSRIRHFVIFTLLYKMRAMHGRGRTWEVEGPQGGGCAASRLRRGRR